VIGVALMLMGACAATAARRSSPPVAVAVGAEAICQATATELRCVGPRGLEAHGAAEVFGAADTTFRLIRGGGGRLCALATTGQVACAHGAEWRAVPDLRGVTEVVAGGDLVCGRLATEDRWRCITFGDAPPECPELEIARSGLHAGDLLVLGPEFTCVGLGRRVSCWGRAEHGILGPSIATCGHVEFDLGSHVRALAASARHVCAQTDDGVWCWGDDASGQVCDPAASEPFGLVSRPCHLLSTAVSRVVVGGSSVMVLGALPGGEVGQMLEGEVHLMIGMHGPCTELYGDSSGTFCAVCTGDLVCWGRDPSAPEARTESGALGFLGRAPWRVGF
jgi:hypothetical protein